MCALWMPTACALLCLAHGTEAQDEYLALATVVDSAHDEECCPPTEAHPSLLPERISIIPQEAADAGESLVFDAKPANGASHHVARSVIHYPHYPPLLLLRVLRI